MDSFRTLTTFKVGGAVTHVERPGAHEAFIKILEGLKGQPFIILGGGSNVLGSDDGYQGTMVIPSFSDISVQEDTITADAGASWDRVVEEAVRHGLWGIENLSGIPGTVGGAVVANIGAYGAALSSVLESVEVFDVARAERRTLRKDECGATYRMTIFKKEPERYGILRATLKLSEAPRPNLGYRDLAERFRGVSHALAEIRDAVIEIRTKKFPPLSEFGTAGSFFLNPVLPEMAARAMQEKYPDMPLFPMPEGGVKVPLAWLLDHVLNARGMREGGAFLWDAQLLVIAAERDATSRDVRSLADSVSLLVKEKTGIEIFPEVRIV